MNRYTLKRTASGDCEVWGPGGVLGVLPAEEIRAYARQVLGMKDGEEAAALELTTGTAATQLHHLVRAKAKAEKVSEREALNLVLASERGRQLWGQKRADDLAESAMERKWEERRCSEDTISLTLASAERNAK